MANILVFSYVNVHCINVSFLLGSKKIAYNSAGDHSLCIGISVFCLLVPVKNCGLLLHLVMLR